MNFKYIKDILPVAAVALSMGLSSCVNDLDVTPNDPSLATEVDPEGLYAKCYANMAVAGNGGANGDCDIDGLDGGTTGFVRQLWNSQELTTDEAICGWGDTGIPQFNFNSWDASHPMLQGFYYRLYGGIDFCNQYLSVCADYNEAYTAEVHFLRDLYYSYLIDAFGGVPYTEKVAEGNPEYATRTVIFDSITTDLKKLIAEGHLLPSKGRTSSDATEYGRADVDAAKLLLARLYLNAQVYTGTAHWDEAMQYAQEVISGGHSLNMTASSTNGMSAYQELFCGNNGEINAAKEAILAIKQDGVTTTSWGTTLFLCAGAWDKTEQTNSMGVRSEDGGKGTTDGWSGNRCRKDLIMHFFDDDETKIPTGADATAPAMIKAAGDDRCIFHGGKCDEWTNTAESDESKQKIQVKTLSAAVTSEFNSGYACSKFINVYNNGGTTHNTEFMDADFFLMRSAEAYLIYAEAQTRKDGSCNSTSLDYLNKLRTRANAAALTSANLKTILNERQKEFYFEGYRRTDLIRFGYYGGSNDYKWEWKGGQYDGTSFSAEKNVFAIPQNDINSNPNLAGHQNPGY